MGRPWDAFFIFPYFPNQRGPLWVNFRSPLVWDVFAISTYFTISLVFWYLGMIPDLATLRDRAPTGLKKVVFRASQPRLERLAAHLVALRDGQPDPGRRWRRRWSSRCTRSSAWTSRPRWSPGWHTTIFPPYFVAGAIYSGFGMVLTLLIITRQTMHLQRYITMRHLEAMAKVIAADRLAGRLRLRDRVLHRLVLAATCTSASTSSTAPPARTPGAST